MPPARAGCHLHLDHIIADEPRLHVVITQGVRHELFLKPVIEQHLALHIAGIFEACDEAGLVKLRVFTRLLHRALGVGGIPVVDNAALPVMLKHRPYGVLIVAGKVEKVVEVGARKARALDHGGVLDVGNTGRPPQIEGRDARPGEARHLFHRCLTILIGDGGHDAHHRTLDHRKRKQRQVGDELGQRLVEAARLEELIELVLGNGGLVGIFLLRCLTR